MPKDHEIFLNHIESIFGKAEVIKMHPCPKGGIAVSVFIYKDTPEEGMVTGITYGLSCYPYPDWKLARPEMILSVESKDIMWPWVAAYFCAEFRGERRFSYGDVFTTESPLASDTKMDGLLVFAQSILEKEVESVELNEYRVHFNQFYPIYRSELDVYRQLGLEKFWKHPDFELFNPHRAPITLPQ